MGKKDEATIRASIADRIDEAAQTLRRMPDKEREMLMRGDRGQSWPGILYTAAEHAAWTPTRMRRPPPDCKQIDRMYEVLDWLLVLARHDRDYFRAVWLMCAERKKNREAANIIGIHRETASIWCANGLDRIAHHLRISSPESIELRDTMMQGMHHPKRSAG